ncbi:hypothetical protein C8035_v006957 [Colletotrichum spinosum]|uniref:Uncharacterized protein n=1 Tax=Colletotrichum spinosum TaxID=1347390 RepID=A0A4R8QSK5_9PEZI|nr:hypothetical protein C8035_v006957 [Colletotrichum spinosum]
MTEDKRFSIMRAMEDVKAVAKKCMDATKKEKSMDGIDLGLATSCPADAERCKGLVQWYATDIAEGAEQLLKNLDGVDFKKAKQDALSNVAPKVPVPKDVFEYDRKDWDDLKAMRDAKDETYTLEGEMKRLATIQNDPSDVTNNEEFIKGLLTAVNEKRNGIIYMLETIPVALDIPWGMSPYSEWPLSL